MEAQGLGLRLPSLTQVSASRMFSPSASLVLFLSARFPTVIIQQNLPHFITKPSQLLTEGFSGWGTELHSCVCSSIMASQLGAKACNIQPGAQSGHGRWRPAQGGSPVPSKSLQVVPGCHRPHNHDTYLWMHVTVQPTSTISRA